MTYMTPGTKARIRRELRSIDSSEETADKLRKAADAVEALSVGNDVLADEVRRLRSMAVEYIEDAEERREDLAERYTFDEIMEAGE